MPAEMAGSAWARAEMAGSAWAGGGIQGAQTIASIEQTRHPYQSQSDEVEMDAFEQRAVQGEGAVVINAVPVAAVPLNSAVDLTAELRELAQMKDQGVLDEDEFKLAKKRLHEKV